MFINSQLLIFIYTSTLKDWITSFVQELIDNMTFYIDQSAANFKGNKVASGEKKKCHNMIMRYTLNPIYIKWVTFW